MTKTYTRRRTATNASLEENKSDEKTVAVTTKESLDGIREKAMMIANLDELGASSSARRWSNSRGAENDRNTKANEIVRDIVGSTMKERDVVVVYDRKSTLWKHIQVVASNGKLEHRMCRRSKGFQDQR